MELHKLAREYADELGAGLSEDASLLLVHLAESEKDDKMKHKIKIKIKSDLQYHLQEARPRKLKKRKVNIFHRIHYEIVTNRFWIGAGIAVFGVAARGAAGRMVSRIGEKIAGADKKQKEIINKEAENTELYRMISIFFEFLIAIIKKFKGKEKTDV